MDSFLFDDSSSSSEHNEFDYVTPIRKNPVFYKLFHDVNDIIDVDNYGYEYDLNLTDTICWLHSLPNQPRLWKGTHLTFTIHVISFVFIL